MDEKKHDQPLSKPDPETLHTTDPQENMEGPVSSVMQNIKHTAEDEDIHTGSKEQERGVREDRGQEPGQDA